MIDVIHSLADTWALASLLEDVYALTNVHCQLIQTTIRDTYQVTADQGRFVFCIYPQSARRRERIEAELAFIDHLHRRGLSVAPSIPRPSGDELSEGRLLSLPFPEGERYGVLSTFVSGRTLKGLVSPETAEAYGRAIGGLHELADELPGKLARPVFDGRSLLLEPLEALASTGALRPHEVAYVRQVTAELSGRIEKLPTKPPTFGLVHGDVIPSNALVNPAGEVTLLDFDLCGYCWRAYDVATFLTEVHYWQLGEGVAQAFLAGYEANRPLAAWERENLPLFEAARNVFALGLPAIRINQWGSRQISEQIIEKYLAGIRHSMKQLPSPSGPKPVSQ